MLTKSDKKYIEETIDTKLDEKLKSGLNSQEKRFSDKLVEFKDAILTEIKAMREELAIIIGYKDQIEDHETRITKLESSLEPQN